MTNIKFLPWIGKEYDKGICGKKTVVLGESHYCASLSDATPYITRNIINDLLAPQSPHESYKNTYTKFERALAGRKLDYIDKSKLWNSVIFYNYVQTPISGARIAPTEEMFRSSDSAFFEMLNLYKPDKIIVWGQRLYDQLPNQGHSAPDIILSDGYHCSVWAYPLGNGHTAEALHIMHPSSAFTPGYWHEAISKFINR